MDSVKMAEFLFTRIQQTIAKKQYIREVKIGYSFNESYGNAYISLTYALKANADFHELPFQDQHTMFKGDSHYVYSISSSGQSERAKEISRVIAFRNIYESITAYATLQLETNLQPNTSIKIKSIHLWPNSNYAEKYLNQLVAKQHFYPDIYEIKSDTWQWEPLHLLALKSKKKLFREKCLISDLEIFERYGFSTADIRRYVISCDIPIKVKGVKIISEILISVPALIYALKTNTSPLGYNGSFPGLINNLYDHYLPEEKAAIIQRKQAAYLQDFIIQPGDLVVLNNKRIVLATIINMDITYRIHVTYTMLKNNLQPGGRTRTVDISEISSVLKAPDFQEYLRNNSVHHFLLLQRWMEKKKIVITELAFNPGLG
jgi:hypothetical protein